MSQELIRDLVHAVLYYVPSEDLVALLARAKEAEEGRNVEGIMNDKKAKVTVTLTRKEADWLLNLLTREHRANVTDKENASPTGLAWGFQAESIADRIRAEG
jgi:hypothetical protein